MVVVLSVDHHARVGKEVERVGVLQPTRRQVVGGVVMVFKFKGELHGGHGVLEKEGHRRLQGEVVDEVGVVESLSAEIINPSVGRSDAVVGNQ